MPIAALILAGSTAFAQTATKTVIISGSVIDDSGNSVSGAVVYYNNSPKYQRDSSGHARAVEPAVSSLTQTGKDGTFSLVGLPQSVYWLCAVGTKPTHLRSCDWGRPTTRVDATSVTVVTGIKLQITDGVLLTFSVTDAAGRISEPSVTPGSSWAPGNFHIFAYQGTYFKSAPLVTAAGAVRLYQLAVPKTATITPSFETTLKVLDSGGAAVAPHVPAAPIAIAGQPATVRFTVQ